MKDNDNTNRKLTPYLSVIEALGIAFGCSIGWSCFMMPGTTFLPAAGPLGTMIGMICGAVVMLLFCYNYHVLINRFPEAGGAYSYTKHAFGADHGFLCSWFLVFTYLTLIWANATSIPLVIHYLIGDMFRFGYLYSFAGYRIYFGEALLSIFVIVFTGAICILQKKGASLFQTVLAAIMGSGIIITFATVFAHSNTGTIAPAFSNSGLRLAQVLRVLAITPWAFVGFEAISHSAEEYKFSSRRAGPVMAVAIVLSLIAYCLMTAQVALGIPAGFDDWTVYIASLGSQKGIWSVPTIAAAVQGAGHAGFILIGVTILSALFTTMLAAMISVSRLLYSMGRDGIGPKPVAALNSDGVPENAIVFTVLISLFVPFLGRAAVGWNVELSNIGAAIAYGYISAAVYKFAERRQEKVSGIVGAVISVILVLLLFFPNYLSGGILSTESYLVLAGWCILGFILFRSLLKKDEYFRFGRSMVVWLGLLGLIFLVSILWDQQTTQRLNQQTVDDVSAYYNEELEHYGVRQTDVEVQKETRFLQETLKHANRAQNIDTVIQTGLLLITMLILFNIYSMMQKREKRAESEKMLASTKSHAKSIFLSNMSHDIRTPMNAIIGFTNLALRDVQNPEKTQEHLTKVLASSEHLLSLINDILEMSRIESGEVEIIERPCNLPEILHNLNAMIMGQVETKQLELSMVALDVQDENVYCDKLRLSQALLNLLTYAVNYTPSGGRITVRIAQYESDKAGFGSYEFTVKDNGHGMSPVFAERIFDSFEREETSTISVMNGGGLGLALTKRFVELMGGTISLTTAPGEGCEFTVRLDFRLQETEKIDWSIASLNGVRALVVDEDGDVCRSLTAMLVQMGLKAESMRSGKEAVLQAREAVEGQNAYSIYLIDWRMSEISGIETARRIRRTVGQDVPIILITTNDWSNIRDEAQTAGITEFCEKPIFISELHRTLLQVFEGKSYQDKTTSFLPSYKGHRVLLVEDIEINRDVTTMLLEDYQIDVDCVYNGKEAVERIQEFGPGYYDLIFMDIQMPVMNGYEATRQIRALDDKLLASIPIVAMTANAFEEDRSMALQSGMNGHIAKPIDVKLLEDTLKSFLH